MSQPTPGHKKVLLMGGADVGKTSIRAIIFANYIAANDTMRLGATQQIENHHVRFLNGLSLSLWDCGGQKRFRETYFASQRPQIFSQAEVLVYVIDVAANKWKKDVKVFGRTVDALINFSPGSRVFVLLHKMDAVSPELREQLPELEAELKQVTDTHQLHLTTFMTSIWDETLYKAWSAIVSSLIPNVNELEAKLAKLVEVTGAEEIVLFERATFLVIAHSKTASLASDEDQKPGFQRLGTLLADSLRFERISYIVKRFKLSCSYDVRPT